MSDFSEENVTIILPTLNEADTIESMLSALGSLYSKLSILVVDDQSKDATQAIVLDFKKSKNDRVDLLARIDVEDRGITASVVDGISKIKTDYFLVMDADMQHPPSVVAAFLQEFDSGIPFVVGARLPYVEKQAFHRVCATKISTWAAKFVLWSRGIRIGDPMSGLFGGQRSLVMPLIENQSTRFEPRGYKVLFDILRTIDPVPKITQVWYDFGVRHGGRSKLRAAHAWYFFKSLWK